MDSELTPEMVEMVRAIDYKLDMFWKGLFCVYIINLLIVFGIICVLTTVVEG